MAEAVAEHSYGATTIAHVVSHAGVSRKTFYEHFRDKEHCFLAMYDTGIAFVVGRLTEALEAAEDPRERLIEGLRTFLTVLSEEPAFCRSIVLEVTTRPARPAWHGAGPCSRSSRAGTSRSTARRASAIRRSSRCRATWPSGSWARYWSWCRRAWKRDAPARLPELTEPLSEFVVRSDAGAVSLTAKGLPPAAARQPIPPFTDEHEQLRGAIRRFVASELRPHVGEWEDAGWFPNEVFTRMAEARLRLGLKYPERYGGQGGDHVHDAVLVEELTGAEVGGLSAKDRRAHRDRHPADLEVRHRGPEAALPGAGDPRGGSPPSRSPSPAPGLTWPGSGPSRARSTAATWSTGRRRSSRTACGRTSS